MKNLVGQRKLGGKEESKQDWTCPWQARELKPGSSPNIGANVWDRGETFEAESEAVDL